VSLLKVTFLSVHGESSRVLERTVSRDALVYTWRDKDIPIWDFIWEVGQNFQNCNFLGMHMGFHMGSGTKFPEL
jgi:hypothetical protein